MARWRAQRRLSDAELLAAFRWWRDQAPPWDAPRWEQEQHIAGVRRWCEQNGTTVLKMVRLHREDRGANYG